MARRFAKVTEEEIEEAFFCPSDLVNTKTTIPVRVGEERWIYTSKLRVSVYIHRYSPPLRGIVVCYIKILELDWSSAALICNSNWSEWSTIQGVIGRVISKSAEREARGRFEIMSAITT